MRIKTTEQNIALKQLKCIPRSASNLKKNIFSNMYPVKMSLIVVYDIKLYCRLNQAIIMVVEMPHFNY